MATFHRQSRLAWLQGPSAKCEHVPCGGTFPWRIVLLGAPGVGKGTQADLLTRRLLACHLSTGDVFRQAGTLSEESQSPAIKEALAYMRRGDLVPDTTVWETVQERGSCLRCAGGFILDGFPRTVAQAVSLKQWMDTEGLALTAVVNYTLPASEIVGRLAGRRICEKCKALYHISKHPTRHCDRCGGRLFQREDDRPESIKVRLEAYDRSTAPLVEFYEKLGLLMEVSGEGSPEEICNRTIPELESRRMARSAEQLWINLENHR